MNKKHILPLVVSGLFCAGMTFSLARPLAEEQQTDKVVEVIKNQDPVMNKQISLSFPQEEQVIDILRPNVVNYINDMHSQREELGIENDYKINDYFARADVPDAPGGRYTKDTDKVDVRNYAKGKTESKSKLVSLVFSKEGFEEEDVFKVKYGLKEDLSDAKEIETTDTYVTVTNLLANETYYWQVSSGETSSAVQSFKTREGFRMITASGISNIRDMGGRLVEGGKHIKQGIIFRGSELVEETYYDGGSEHSKTLTPENKAILRDELGIKYEVDFRGDSEANYITESPLKDEDHEDIEYMRIPNMTAYDYLIKSSSESLMSGLKNMFLKFKNANEKHVYFHCWGGADRTGTAGFLLGGVLGMSLTDLIVDFELTSFGGNNRYHDYNDPEKNVFRFPSLLYEVVEGSTLSPYRTEGALLKDVIAGFLINKVGLTQEDIDELRANLLED